MSETTGQPNFSILVLTVASSLVLSQRFDYQQVFGDRIFITSSQCFYVEEKVSANYCVYKTMLVNFQLPIQLMAESYLCHLVFIMKIMG